MLRPYQSEAAGAVMAAWADGVRRPAVVLPCGMGKTVIFAELCRIMAAHAGRRPLVLVNRDELVRQTVRKLWAADPSLPIGVIQGNRHDVIGAKIVVASVQTISRQSRLDKLDPNRFDVIVADECHYSAADSWQRVLAHFGALSKDSGTLAVGFTATMSRSDNLGLGDTWESIAYQLDVSYGIENDYLSPVEGVRTPIVGLDLKDVKKSRGDYSDTGLADALSASHAAEQVAEAYVREACGPDGLPRRGILFAPTVESAQDFAEAFNAAGVVTEVVVGSTPVADRQAAYARVESGVTRVLASVMVLAVGFDLPCVEVAVMARPTKSKGLYVQQAGRVFRKSPETGKESALIMDVTGVSELGLVSFADLRTTRPPAPPAESVEELEPKGPRAPVEKVTLRGSIDLRPIDPITGAPLGAIVKRKSYSSAWLQTRGNVPFLPPTRTFPGLLFVTVGQDGARGWYARSGRGAEVVFRGPDLYSVMLDVAEMHPGEPPTWGALAATDKQVGLLSGLGGDVRAGMTMVEASRAISVAKVSRYLDGIHPGGRHLEESA